MNLTLPSPAKINLFLHVVGKRGDGYHHLQTAFQFLDLCDELSFTSRSDGEILIQSSIPNLAIEDNLIWKAAKLLQDVTHTSLGAHIILKKNIPLGAGLGGGSSNAASTLLALNLLWRTNLSASQLLELGTDLGADVPIFLFGKSAWAEGIGERLTAIKLPEKWYLLVNPLCEVETKKIFSDPQLSANTPIITLQEFQNQGGQNDCEPITRKHYPSVDQALTLLARFAKAKMTGTGSCVFAEFTSRSEAEQIQKKLPDIFPMMIVKGQNDSPFYKSIKKFAANYKN